MTSDDFKKLKEKVLFKRPILQEILRKRGQKKLYDYAKEYVSVNLNPPIKRRQDEFLKTLEKEISRNFDEKIAMEVVKQLRKHYFVCTADHQGPLCHPFFVNSNLLTAVPFFDSPQEDFKYITVLSCANISINNHSFPKGLIFNSFKNDKLQLHRLPFFSNKTTSSIIYNLPAYGVNEIKNIKEILRVKLAKGEVSKKEAKIIYGVIDEIYNTPEALSCSNYSDQVIKTNFKLWKKFFAPSKILPPEIVYVELESLVVKLLIEHHLYEDTVINHIIFDPSYESLIKQYFEGIHGAYSSEDNSGTYLFWAVPKGQKHRLQLWRKENFLVSNDGSYEIELTADKIKKALEDKELIPGLMIDYTVVSFYYGLKCIGGFNQVNYLTFMKNAYIKMNADLGNYRSIEVCARAQTKEMADGLTIAFLTDPKGDLALATGLDLILYGTEYTWTKFIELTKKITFEEALNPLLPEIYRITYDEKEWDQDLISITDRDISKLTELDKKIEPCIELS